MEDVKHYNQTLIDMKKQLACILGASQTTQMEAKLIRIQVEYHENWYHEILITQSWAKVFEMNFPNSLSKL